MIVQRVFDMHNNHAITDSSDGHSHSMDSDLRRKMEEHGTLEKKPDIILAETHKWARNRGHSNIHDRTYFATPQDIDNIRTTVTRRKRFHSNDSQSVEGLQSEPLRERVVFYQPYTSSQ